MKKNMLWMILFTIVIIVLMILSFSGIINETIGMCVTLGLVVLYDVVMAVIAYKHEVKAVFIIMILLTIIGVAMLAFNIKSMAQTDIKTGTKYYISVEESSDAKTKMFSFGGKDYYRYNLSKVEVIDGVSKRAKLLENLMEIKAYTLDDILSTSIADENTKGYKIYYDGGVNTRKDDKFSLVVCENNNSIVFAPYDYTYSPDICN